MGVTPISASRWPEFGLHSILGQSTVLEEDGEALGKLDVFQLPLMVWFRLPSGFDLAA